MGGRYGGDPTKRGKQPAWRVSVEVLAAIGREVKPNRGRIEPSKPKTSNQDAVPS